jgi:hypothetical protein
MKITGEVGDLHLENLEIKNSVTTTPFSILAMDDTNGFVQDLTILLCKFDGENNSNKAIFPNAGEVRGKLSIT